MPVPVDVASEFERKFDVRLRFPARVLIVFRIVGGFHRTEHIDALADRIKRTVRFRPEHDVCVEHRRPSRLGYGVQLIARRDADGVRDSGQRDRRAHALREGIVPLPARADGRFAGADRADVYAPPFLRYREHGGIGNGKFQIGDGVDRLGIVISDEIQLVTEGGERAARRILPSRKRGAPRQSDVRLVDRLHRGDGTHDVYREADGKHVQRVPVAIGQNAEGERIFRSGKDGARPSVLADRERDRFGRSTVAHFPHIADPAHDDGGHRIEGDRLAEQNGKLIAALCGKIGTDGKGKFLEGEANLVPSPARRDLRGEFFGAVLRKSHGHDITPFSRAFGAFDGIIGNVGVGQQYGLFFRFDVKRRLRAFPFQHDRRVRAAVDGKPGHGMRLFRKERHRAHDVAERAVFYGKGDDRLAAEGKQNGPRRGVHRGKALRDRRRDFGKPARQDLALIRV